MANQMIERERESHAKNDRRKTIFNISKCFFQNKKKHSINLEFNEFDVCLKPKKKRFDCV